jgi:KaiC/GvpD/RAD55 family RecA-like ATPase
MCIESGPKNGGRSEVDTISPQPTVMVTGSVGRQLRSVAIELFDQRTRPADGAVAVTTREPPTAVVRRLTAGPDGFQRERIAVVDARGTATDDEPEVGSLIRKDPAADPAALDEATTRSLRWLKEAGVGRRHFLYDTLATGYRLPDEETAYDRAHRIAMTVGAEDGLALFTLDDDGLSADVVERLGHLFDVHVELREHEGETELRWTGLLGASEGWVDLSEADLGVGGFR